MNKSKVKIDPVIFRDYDIRGIYPKQLNEDTYYIIGRAIAVFLKEKEIAVGYDTRLSSSLLFRALVAGICRQGVNVIDLGLISTEINYFASGFFHFPVNVIVSASHNPAEYNGLKIVKKDVVPLSGSYGLPEIKKLSLEQNFPEVNEEGQVRKLNINKDWTEHLLTIIDYRRLKPFKIVIDAGNGMAGLTWKKLMSKLPVKIIPLYFEPDGHFPNHLPDPLIARNTEDLRKKIIESEADLGFAVDGDADRLFVLDDQGELLSGTITTAILAEHLLKKNGPGDILYSVTCGKIVPQIIKKYKGNPVRTRVGHSFIKALMKKKKALFAGEHSGHFYFRKNFFADSSTVAGLLFLEYLSSFNKPLSQIRKIYEINFPSGEINYYIDDKKKIFNNLIGEFPDAKTDRIDGITFDFTNWWFNIRASNTEPLIRLNIEADKAALLEEKKDYLNALITSYGGKLKSD